MAEELATAFINLVPSMRGFEAKISSQLDTTALGKTMGRQIGRGMTSGMSSAVSLPNKLKTEGRTTGKTTGVNFRKGFETQTDKIKLPDKMGADAGDKGKKSGGLFGDKFALAAAATVATATALIVDGFKSALDRQVSTAKTGQQLGLTPTFAKALGETTGRIFAENFGSSLEEVNTAALGVIKNIGGPQTPATFDDLTKKALTFASTMNQDVGRSTAAAGTLVRTGLAKNGSEAFDILTRAMQGPSNKADDLLDTTIEYSTLFRNLGIDGKDAFGLISQGVGAGARSSDQAADALKEFSIRAVDGTELTAKSFSDLGLDAKTMAADIASGGPRAAKALDKTLDAMRNILDPVKRGQVAVGLFGTQAEDMGKALFAMDLDTASAQMDNTAGAAGRMVDAMGGTDASKFETFKRGIQTNVVDFMENVGIPALEAGADAFHNIFGEDSGASLRAGADLFARAWDEDVFPRLDSFKTALFGEDAGASLRTAASNLAAGWDDVFGADAGASLRAGVDTIKTSISGLWDNITTGVDTVKSTVSGLWADLLTGATELPGKMWDALKGVWDVLPATFLTALDTVVNFWNGLAIPQIGPFTVSAFGWTKDIGPFGPFDLPDIRTPWRGDQGGVVPGVVGSEQFIIAHGGETLVPTHKPQLAAFRGVDAALAAASSPGAGGGATTPVPHVGAMNFYNVREADTAWTVRHELHKLSLLGGGR